MCCFEGGIIAAIKGDEIQKEKRFLSDGWGASSSLSWWLY